MIAFTLRCCQGSSLLDATSLLALTRRSLMAWFARVRRPAVLLALVVGLLAAFAPPASAQFVVVTNPVVRQRADTAIYKHTDGYYYMTASVPDYKRVELRRATTLQGLGSAPTVNAFTAPSS